MSMLELIDARRSEGAARELCRVAYDALMDARRSNPRDAVTMEACRRDLARAEERHCKTLARLWRARAACTYGGEDECA